MVDCKIAVLAALLALCYTVAPSTGILTSVNRQPQSLCNNPRCDCGYQSILCKCDDSQQEMIVELTDELTITNFTITGCRKVTFPTHAINAVRSLRYVNILNIGDLRLENYSLKWDGGDSQPYYKYDSNNKDIYKDTPRLAVRISDTFVYSVGGYSFQGKIKEVHLTNVQINQIETYAFSNLYGTENIIIKNSVINDIKIKAFIKFKIDTILVLNTTFKSPVTSQTFSDLELTQLFKIGAGSSFNSIRSSGFIVNDAIKTEIWDSNFKNLDGEAFKMTMRGDISFRNNKFESISPNAFSGIIVHKNIVDQIGPRNFEFEKNTVTDLYQSSLDVNRTSYNFKLSSLVIDSPCSCPNLDRWVFYNSKLSEMKCRNDDKKIKETYLTLEYYKSQKCKPNSNNIKVIVAVVSVLVIIIVVIIVITIYYFKRRQNRSQKEWINNASPIIQKKYRNTNGNSDLGRDGKLPIIVPDGRTYRETELHVIVEKAEVLTTEL